MYQHCNSRISQVLVLSVCLSGLTGCGDTPDDSSSVAQSPDERSVATTSTPSTTSHANTKTPSPSDPLAEADNPIKLGSPGELTAEEKVVSEDAAAREAFLIMITPGSESAAWDAAQRRLIESGAKAIPTLVRGLNSSQAIDRETATTLCALMETVDPALQAALVKCLSDESAYVRANAAAALTPITELHSQVIASLTSLLGESDPQLRRMAAANLGSFGEEAKSEIPKLTAILSDNDAEVVTPVIELLGRIGPQAVDAVPQLQKIAFEQKGDMKQAAEQALQLIQTNDVQEP